MLLRYRWFSLTKIFRLSKYILCYWLEIFNGFLDNHCLGKLRVDSFRMKRQTSSLRNLFFCISESVLCLWNRPHVISMFLFSWTKSSMSFVIHCRHFWPFFFFSTCWIQNILCAFTTNCRSSKSKFLLFCYWRKSMPSYIWFSKRLSLMALILWLLQIIMIVSKPC